MGRQARGEVMDPAQIQIFHCTHRCVRRAFLCGNDPYSGVSYEHRRQWIRNRLEFLASIFGIDCLTYTVMSNHLHQVLRSRPDVVAGWSDHEWERSRGCPHSGWMSPIEIDERTDPLGQDHRGQDHSATSRRASEKGFLPISLCTYLELLDWTGRQLRSGKRGSIPNHLASILSRLGLNPKHWSELVSKFGGYFKRVAGTAAHLREEATRRGQRRLHCPGCLA